MAPIAPFSRLLESLNCTDSGERLARLSVQVKIEQAILAEVMLNGNELFPQLDFYLEESLRDLTVRTRERHGKVGRLLEWVEAKMCYSDCIARRLTGHSHAAEYCELLLGDARKQEVGLDKLPKDDRNAALSLLLFVLHRDAPIPRQKYYPKFRNRRKFSSKEIEDAALKYAEGEIVETVGRAIRESFTLALGEGCRLHVFLYRR